MARIPYKRHLGSINQKTGLSGHLDYIISMGGTNILTVNADGTLVRVEFRGQITEAEISSHLGKVMALESKIVPGFTLFNDLSNLDTMDFACSSILGKVMDRFSDYGVGRIIRVIPDPNKDIGFNILSIFHYNSGIPITTFSSLTEAEAFCAGLPRSLLKNYTKTVPG